MRTVEERLHALSTTPAPAPPALDDLRTRVRARRRRRVSTAAGAVAVLGAVAVAVLAWSTLAGSDVTPDLVAGPRSDEPGGNICDGMEVTSPPAPDADRVRPDDPVRLACMALAEYGNDGPPSAVRVGQVDTATFVDWQRERSGAVGPLNGPTPPDTVTVLLVRARDGELSAPHPRAGSSGRLRGDSVYVVFHGEAAPEAARSAGAGTWSELTAAPWAHDLEEIDVD